MSYLFKGMPMPIPIKTSYPIKEAEQTKPQSRAARRQEKRESERKWPVKYLAAGEGTGK